MIDIHTHVLPFVDDGSDGMDKTLTMLKSLAQSGVTDVVCTPHLRANFRASKEELVKHFSLLKSEVESQNIPLSIYLGRELYVSKHYKENVVKFGATMPNEKYVLVEFDFGFECEITETVYELSTAGYIPIVAHPERYDYMTFEDAVEVKNMGGLLQVNADSVVASCFSKSRRFVDKLFRNGLVDFVASDIHYGRKNNLKKAQKHVSLKYGKDVADAVFNENAKKIIEG